MAGTIRARLFKQPFKTISIQQLENGGTPKIHLRLPEHILEHLCISGCVHAQCSTPTTPFRAIKWPDTDHMFPTAHHYALISGDTVQSEIPHMHHHAQIIVPLCSDFMPYVRPGIQVVWCGWPEVVELVCERPPHCLPPAHPFPSTLA